jgi:uncharacterized repeat protein (TIGR01451 family)
MRRFTALAVLCGVILLSINALSADSQKGPFYYLSPLPGAERVTKQATIIFRPNADFAAQQGDWTKSVEVNGSVSGLHMGDWVAARDNKTVIFKPLRQFTPGETVRVTVPGWSGTMGEGNGFEFEFTISPKTSDWRMEEAPALSESFGFDASMMEPSWDSPPMQRTSRVVEDVSGVYELPQDFPSITITAYDDPAPGYIFLSNSMFFGRPGSGPPQDGMYLLILKNTGEPVYFQEVFDRTSDFKMQPDGRLSFIMGGRHYLMDSTYTVVDSVWAQSYPTDGHDMQVLPNGNFLLLATDTQPIDMSEIVEGGDPDATVIHRVVQELDSDKNVVFEWNTKDHFSILDGTHQDLTGRRINYAHINSVELDNDGNILVSCRHMDEITKINRQTGDIIWRFGGKNNEFELIGETKWFSHQHDCRRQENGNITMFDNGNFVEPEESRALEFELDEVNKKATVVWEYRNDPKIYGSAMGNAHRLDNGNTVIGWGSTNPNVTEVRPDGSKAFELTFVKPTVSYRAFRYEWEGVASTPTLWANRHDGRYVLNFTKFGDGDVKHYNIYRGAAPNPESKVGETAENQYDIGDMELGATEYFRVTAVDDQDAESPFSNEIEVTQSWIDLSLTKTVTPEDARVGEPVTFTITLRNDGDYDGTGITVSDTLPEGYKYTGDTGGGAFDLSTGIWDVGSLAEADVSTLDIMATVMAVEAQADYENTAQVATANELDPNSIPGNNDPAEDDQDKASIVGTEPRIFAVRDVPGDNGGVVYLSWYGTALDDIEHLSHYTIWRAIAPTDSARSLISLATLVDGLADVPRATSDPVVRIERTESGDLFWELVDSHDAYYFRQYSRAVPTLFDSTAACQEYHFFQVVAHSSNPKLFWVSEMDSGYSVDNLPPAVPTQLAAQFNQAEGVLSLSWTPGAEPDLSGYHVYGGMKENFEPSAGSRMTVTEEPQFIMQQYSLSDPAYFKVSAVDKNGNESGWTSLTPDEIEGMNQVPPLEFALEQNYPNPFNPTTIIPFSLVEDGDVILEVFDVSGAVVRTIVDRRMSAGRYTEKWDGRDDRGTDVGTGVYFFRLQSSGKTMTRKAVLLK